MTDNYFAKRRKLAVVLAVVVLLIVLVVGVYDYVRFHVVNTDPSISAVATDSPYIDINFNEDLSTKGLAIGYSSGLVRSYSVNGKELNLVLNEPMNQNNKYFITIKSIKSASGRIITNKEFTFNVKQIPFSELSKGEQQALLKPQLQYNETVENNALLSKLPFLGPGLAYEISYTLNPSNTSEPIIQITSPSSVGDQEALSWISSLGYNPATLHIQYISGQP